MNNNLNTAISYCTSLKNKDLESLEKCIHPKIQFIGPLAKLTGKENVLEGAKKIFSIINRLTIRSKFASENDVMLVYDLECHDPIGILHVAALMTFKDNLIARLELFYDARAFERKKEEVLS